MADPIIATPPNSDDFVRANSLIQFAATLLHGGANPFIFGRSFRDERTYYFCDVFLGERQLGDYVRARQGDLYTVGLRIYMIMHPEEYERAGNIFLPNRGADEHFNGMVTNNAHLPIRVCVSPGGVWVEICDTRPTHPRRMYSRRIENADHAECDNWFHGINRGVYRHYNLHGVNIVVNP